MQIKFKCECGQTLKVAQEAAGKTGKCPACGRQVRIPTIEEIQAQPMPVQIVSEPAQPPSDTGLKEPPAPPVPQARPSAPAQLSSETGLKKAPVAQIPKGRSAIDRVKARRAKPAPGLRTGRGVRVRARGAEEEEEEYEAPADKKKKQLIIAGVIAGLVIIALIVLYAGYLAPRAAQKTLYLDYIEKAKQFASTVTSEICNRYASGDMPGTASFSRSVSAVKTAFEDGPNAVTEGHSQMRQNLDSYGMMKKVLEKLAAAQSLLQQKEAAASDQTKMEQITADFRARIQECKQLAVDIEKGAESLRKKVE